MAEQIRELLRTTPFVPFAIFLSNGTRYEIRHPENALLTKHFLIVVDADNDEVARHLYLLHIVELTRLTPAGA